ncbi:protein lines homolog isoform X1 [Amblyomma americanum]
MAAVFQKAYDRLLSGCACEIKQDLISWINHDLNDLLGSTLQREDTLLGLTALHAVFETARKSLQKKAICPVIQEVVTALSQKETAENLMNLQLLTADKFTAHCCLITLNSLARCSMDLQQHFFSNLGKHLDRLTMARNEEKTRCCQLLTFLMTADTKSCHPEETNTNSCPVLTVSTLQTANLHELSSAILSAAVKCLHNMLPLVQEGASHDVLYPSLSLWLRLVHSHCSMDVLGGSLPQRLIQSSMGEDPLVANMALEILDQGLHPVTAEAQFSKVPLWVPSVGKQVIEAVQQGWFDKLCCRTGFCGFAGTRKEPSLKHSEQDAAVPLGDSRMIRRAMLVLLKSAAACLQQGLQEGLPEALEAGFAWLRSKTPSIISTSDVDHLVHLFLEQDDQLMECLLSTLLLHLHRPASWTVSMPTLNPHRMFLKFLGSLGNDHVTLIDFVTSQETCALLYFVRYLKLVLSEWEAFVRCHGELDGRPEVQDVSNPETHARLDVTMAALVRTRIKLEKMSQRRDLLPFSVAPLVRLIEQCELMYENG